MRRLVDRRAQCRHGLPRCAFRREYSHPEIVLDIEAELLERRHVRQRPRAGWTEGRERSQLARFDVWQRGRYGLGGDLGVVAEDGDDSRASAIGRQMPQVQRTRRLFEIRERQMRRAIEPARTEYERVRMRLRAGNELLPRFVGLLVGYEQQQWNGLQATQRHEFR